MAGLRLTRFLLGCAALLACATPQATVRRPSMPVDVPFHYDGHAIAVPVRVGGEVDTTFILDTGIGLNLISRPLCDKLGCQPAGTYEGKRMSGQSIKVDLAKLSELTFGDVRATDVTVGVIDMGGFAEASSVQGFLSLGFFSSAPFTVDYARGVVVMETATSLDERVQRGATVPIVVEDKQGAIGISLGLLLPGERAISVVVDTGSNSLILDDGFMTTVGVSPTDSAVRKVESKDETAHAYVRYFANISGSIALREQPTFSQVAPKVMFQDIIYDGLIGDAFLKQFVVTYDLARGRMVFAKTPAR